MLIDAKPAQNPDTFAAAKEKLRTGPVPDWVTPCQPDYSFAPKPVKNQPVKTPSPTTLLLWNVQTDNESNASHIHMALRLETMQAVQHESQWRLEFEPKTETVTVHWIKIRRGTVEMDHTHLHKIHLLQREAGLEGCVIDGCFTALLLLEDVRPGDVLEWCYTMETRPRLLPDQRFAFYHLPAATPIGKVRFVERFNEQRPMKWKSSGDDFKPEETREQQQVIWRWSRDDFSSPEPEVNIPSWHLACPWIQISDCPDWGVIARAVTAVWEQGAEDAAVAELVEEICAKETDLLPRVEQALRLVQDEFRYLSVNLDRGGQIPTPPDLVARRRFGDCKDLSFLLVHIFRRMGLTAYPVLVNTARRRAIADLLPSSGLFDHVVVQYEVQGETRWVDVTIKNQGGGPLKRVLPNYGYGLVLHAGTTELTKPPAASVAPGTYRIRESILLDTTGASSSVAIVTTTEGSEAEVLRHHFATQPLEQITQERLQHCADRYRNARRIGELKYRDDREPNEFHVAEVFEVNGFLSPGEEYGVCDFFLPPNLVNSSLRLPETRTRRDPFALPQPCNLIHVFEVQTGGLQDFNAPRSRVESQLLRFNRQIRSMPGSWSVILNLTILDEVMPAAQFNEHSRRVQDIWTESTWRLTIPVGYSAANRNRAFGTLPAPPRPITSPRSQSPVANRAANNLPERTAITTTAASQTQPSTPTQTQQQLPLPETESSPRRVRRSKRRRQDSSSSKIVWWVVIGFIIFMIFLIALFASAA